MGTVTVGVSVLVDAGSELPAGSAGAAAVRVAPLAEAVEDTLDVVGMDVGELLFWTDSDDGLPMMSKFVRPDDGPVIALKMLADVLGDDRFSPGVSCCVILDQPVGKLILESVLITHASDILLDKSDTIVDCGRSDLYPTIGLDLYSPDFPDTGDPDFCFGMPRSPNGIGKVESDVDTALLARGTCSRTLMIMFLMNFMKC